MNKRTRIYLLLLVWVAAGLQLFINSRMDREKNMVAEVMAESSNDLAEGCVRAYGYYGNAPMDDEKRMAAAENIAESLGISSNYEIEKRSSGEGEVAALTKKGEYADTEIKVITLNSKETYILTDISLHGTAGNSAYGYKEKLMELYESLGMKVTTNLYLKSQVAGQLEAEERDEIIEDFLHTMAADTVCTSTFDDVYMVYGYSKGVEDYVYQNDKKVNVNIAFTYDEENDVTWIHRGVPFIDKSF